MKRVWFAVVAGCVSFSVSLVIISVLNLVGFVGGDFNSVMILQYFVVTALIGITLGILSGLLPKEYGPVHLAVQVACIMLYVFGLGGGVFHWFPFSLFWVAVVTGIILFIYVCVVGVFVLQAKLDADKINQAIQNRKKQKSIPLKEEAHEQDHLG